ncbi:MAG TPA: CBS domain-containing protein [Terrimicrobiaceae bacterium]
MEMVGLGFLGFVLLGVFSALLVMGNATWLDEEERPRPDWTRHQPVASADQKLPPAHSKDAVKSSDETLKSIPIDQSAVSLGAQTEYPPERTVEYRDRAEIEWVGRIMKSPLYCSRFQSLSVARIMMRENHLQSLPVVDLNQRVVGTITMREIAAFQQNRRK